MKEKAVLRRCGDDEIDALLVRCLKTMESKGRDYTIGSTDRLHNFRTVGSFIGRPMSEVWGTYFYKHVSALFSFIKTGGQSESEPIEDRIMDCIVYLLLFQKISKEMERARQPIDVIS